MKVVPLWWLQKMKKNVRMWGLNQVWCPNRHYYSFCSVFSMIRMCCEAVGIGQNAQCVHTSFVETFKNTIYNVLKYIFKLSVLCS